MCNEVWGRSDAVPPHIESKDPGGVPNSSTCGHMFTTVGRGGGVANPPRRDTRHSAYSYSARGWKVRTRGILSEQLRFLGQGRSRYSGNGTENLSTTFELHYVTSAMLLTVRHLRSITAILKKDI